MDVRSTPTELNIQGMDAADMPLFELMDRTEVEISSTGSVRVLAPSAQARALLRTVIDDRSKKSLNDFQIWILFPAGALALLLMLVLSFRIGQLSVGETTCNAVSRGAGDFNELRESEAQSGTTDRGTGSDSVGSAKPSLSRSKSRN